MQMALPPDQFGPLPSSFPLLTLPILSTSRSLFMPLVMLRSITLLMPLNMRSRQAVPSLIDETDLNIDMTPGYLHLKSTRSPSRRVSDFTLSVQHTRQGMKGSMEVWNQGSKQTFVFSTLILSEMASWVFEKLKIR
jgi:hypothetical protein